MQPALPNDHMQVLMYKLAMAGLELPVGPPAPIYDPDAEAYFNAVLAGSGNEVSNKDQVNKFYTQVKSASLYSDMFVGWTYRNSQNAGTGSTVYDFKLSRNATLIGGPIWGVNGITFDDGLSQFITIPLVPSMANFTIVLIGQSDVYSIVFSDTGSGGIQFSDNWAGNNVLSSFDGGNFVTSNTFSTPATIKCIKQWRTTGGTVSFFENSTERGSGLSSSISVNRIGSYQGTSNFWNGEQAALFFFNIGLTDGQLSTFRSIYLSTIGQGLGI